MRQAFQVVALAALVAVVAPAPHAEPALARFNAPALQYVAEAVMILPYAGTAEPTQVWFDGAGGRSRTDYYDGLDSYFYLARRGTMYQVSWRQARCLTLPSQP